MKREFSAGGIVFNNGQVLLIKVSAIDDVKPLKHHIYELITNFVSKKEEDLAVEKFMACDKFHQMIKRAVFVLILSCSYH